MVPKEARSGRMTRDREQRGVVAPGFCSSVPGAGGTPERKRLDWQRIGDSADVRRRLGQLLSELRWRTKKQLIGMPSFPWASL